MTRPDTPDADPSNEDSHDEGRPAREVREPTSWLVLVYRVPSEPSRLRATVWRRLKHSGAVYLQNSVAVLPASATNERTLRALRAEIGQLGGVAQLLQAEPLAGGADIAAVFNAARDDEYDEIIDKCQDFLAEIDRETTARHFTYAELEENDEDLTKLRRWFDKVAGRDALGAAGAPAAQEALGHCASALDAFAAHVYAADADGSSTETSPERITLGDEDEDEPALPGAGGYPGVKRRS